MYTQLIVIFFVSWFLLLKLKRRHLERLHEQLKISAPRLPLIGHLYLFFCNAEGKMKSLQHIGMEAMRSNSVAVNSLWLGHKLYINIADPEVAGIVMKTCLEKDDVVKCFHIATGDGSIFAAVKTWRPRRKFLAPTFNMKNLNIYVKTFCKQSGILVDKITEQVVGGTNNFSMGKVYMSYSLSAIFESLGIHLNPQENGENTIIIAVEKFLRAVSARMFQPWLYNDFVYKLLPCYHHLLRYKPIVFGTINKNILEKRRQYENSHDDSKSGSQRQPKTFIDLMIESSANISDKAILEECLVMMAAASDTTSVGIGYVTVMLARHPDVQDKVYQEIKKILGSVDRPITAKDLPHLKYLGAVIKETLRLYPSVPGVVRKIDQNIELASGVTLMPGCGAFINIWAINRNPLYWGKDAEEFRPERFLDSTQIHPAAYATFSLGPRNCLGSHYAIMSIKTVIVTLLSKYRLAPPSDDKLEPLRLEYDILMRDIDGYRVKFENRV